MHTKLTSMPLEKKKYIGSRPFDFFSFFFNYGVIKDIFVF